MKFMRDLLIREFKNILNNDHSSSHNRIIKVKVKCLYFSWKIILSKSLPKSNYFPPHKGLLSPLETYRDETHKLGERKKFPSMHNPVVERGTRKTFDPERPIASACPAEKKYWSEDARKRRVRITRLSSYFSGEISVIRAGHPLRLWILTNSGVPGRTRLERDRLDYGWCVRDNPGMKLIFHPQDVLL